MEPTTIRWSDYDLPIGDVIAKVANMIHANMNVSVHDFNDLMEELIADLESIGYPACTPAR